MINFVKEMGFDEAYRLLEPTDAMLFQFLTLPDGALYNAGGQLIRNHDG